MSVTISGGGVKSVQRGTFNLGFTTTGTVTIGAINPEKSVIFITQKITMANTDIKSNLESAQIAAQITSSTQVSLSRAGSYNQPTIEWQVIEYA